MLYLLLSIFCSAALNVVLRLSKGRASSQMAMLAANYSTCAVCGLLLTGNLRESLAADGAPYTLLLSALAGLVYFISLVLINLNIRRSGLVVATLFSKLGVILPTFISVFFFGARLNLWGIIGLVLALFAIVLMNTGAKTDNASADAESSATDALRSASADHSTVADAVSSAVDSTEDAMRSSSADAAAVVESSATDALRSVSGAARAVDSVTDAASCADAVAVSADSAALADAVVNAASAPSATVSPSSDSAAAPARSAASASPASVTRKSALFLMLSLVMSGLASSMVVFFDNTAVPATKNLYLAALFFFAVPCAIIALFINHEKPKPIDFLLGFFVGVPNYFCTRFLLLSLSQVSAAAAYPAQSVGAIFLSCLAGILLFKEKATLRNIISLLLIAAAIILLGLK